MEEKTRPKFSIITPVYNADKFLDRCIDSVVRQTYVNWEMILVDDGSSDNSYQKCLEWSEKDSRIHCFGKMHEGQGKARNLALEKAEGDYVLFLDADDWWELNCLEECSRIIDRKNADIVIFDIRVWGQNGSVNVPKRVPITNQIENAKSCEQIISRNPIMVNKAYRRILFSKNRIQFFDHPYEDEIVGVLLSAYAERIWKLPNIFYNYDQRNMNSTTHNEENEKWFMIQYKKIYLDFIRRNLFGQYRQALGKLMLLLAKAELEKRNNQFIMKAEIGRQCFAILKKYSPEVAQIAQKKLLVWGSYNLRSTANCLAIDIHSVKHYQFSSVIGLMSQGKMDYALIHDNSYRRNMVNCELRRECCELIKSGQLQQYDYVLIDFMEERYDILKIQDDYITSSDAVEEGTLAGYDGKGIKLDALDSKRVQLWEQKCDEFIKLLQQNYDARKVILVKTYLMKGYGEYSEEHEFANLKWIRQVNQRLEHYYEYFEMHFPEITVLSMAGERENFSDVSFKHGCRPWHTNETWFYTLSDKLYAHMEERK